MDHRELVNNIADFPLIISKRVATKRWPGQQEVVERLYKDHLGNVGPFYELYTCIL